MGDVLKFPLRPQMPGPTGDRFLDQLELQMIRLALDDVPRDRLRGLSLARELYSFTHKELNVQLPNSERYLSVLVMLTAELTERQCSALRHPATSRSSAQRVLAS
jgi:hypothetical protein